MGTTKLPGTRGWRWAIMALVVAGCGSGSSSSTTSIRSTAEAVLLDVTVGTKDGPTIATASLAISSDGSIRGTGFLNGADAAAAAAATIATPTGRNRLLNGETNDQACSEIYGGPDLATVTGSIDDHAVTTSFHRANGCGIADWESLQALIGRARWDVDQRVLHRDEAGVDVDVGGHFSIELPSNATTGYAWASNIVDSTMLREVDHHYLSPDTTLVGAGGYERFMFEATGSGSTAISFEYRRPSEPASVAAKDTARFEIRISASAAPTSTSAATSTTTSVASSWATMPSNPAGDALGGFVDAARRLHEGVQPLIVEASGVSAGAAVPPSVTQHAAGAVEQFYALSALISDGLHPDVRTAAIDVVFALGRELAPFLFAPGWESDGWDVWASGVEDAQVDVPETIARLADEAMVNPDASPEDPIGAEGAAFHGGLDVLVVRAFGHENFNTQPPWSVRWISGVPADPAATCSADAQGTAGTFEPQVGGCAMLYYDTTDPASHDSELANWLADPGSEPAFTGEVITVRWTYGRWSGIGSAE